MYIYAIICTSYKAMCVYPGDIFIVLVEASQCDTLISDFTDNQEENIQEIYFSVHMLKRKRERESD